MLKTNKVSLNSSVVQSEGNIVSDMDGEKVMLNIGEGKYYNLGKLGGLIWDLLSEPIKVNDVVSSLINEYEVERSICEEQVLSFIKSLEDEGLVQVSYER